MMDVKKTFVTYDVLSSLSPSHNYSRFLLTDNFLFEVFSLCSSPPPVLSSILDTLLNQKISPTEVLGNNFELFNSAELWIRV